MDYNNMGFMQPGNINMQGAVQHCVNPRCQHCGSQDGWEEEEWLRTCDIVITALLNILYGAGLIYLIVILLYRKDPEKRKRYCLKCGKKM